MAKNERYEDFRYAVYSRERTTEETPAGRYKSFAAAVQHANTVTYGMYVLDTVREEVAYCNWDSAGEPR